MGIDDDNRGPVEGIANGNARKDDEDYGGVRHCVASKLWWWWCWFELEN